MSEYAVMPLSDYVNACNTIRGYTSGDDSDKIKSTELSPRINQIFSNGLSSGYGNGYEDGKIDGEISGKEIGKQAEYDKFWDVFQNYGNEQNYYYAFSYDRFNNENYNPKYDIICSSTATTSSNGVFYGADHITDTKVGITCSKTNVTAIFAHATALETVRRLTVFETTTFSQSFYNCVKLQNIVIDGTIGQDISFANSPLTVESMKSIISHLKDYSGTGSTHTLTFKADRKTMLTDEEKAVATNKGWTLVWR